MVKNHDSSTESTKLKTNLVHGELAELERLEDVYDRRNTSKALMGVKRWWKHINFQIEVVKAHPMIFYSAFSIFFIVCGASLTLIFFFAKFQEEKLETDALGLATETGNWFSSQLDLAILPLFSMAQFVSELEIFQDLPVLVGPPGQTGSLPFLPPFQEDGWITHRNASGVCDDAVILDRFNEIAATVKSNANMDGVLVSIQLVPYEVVCMIYPLVNTEDFPEGVVMNSTGAIGLDLLTDPARRLYGEAVVRSESITIIGPIPLRECQSGTGECEPLVEKAFIAALPVISTDHEILIDGISYPRWGSVEVIINWNALIQRSSVFDRFAEQDKEFQLTRRDRIVDQETNEETVNVVVLAETPNFNAETLFLVSTNLDTTNSEWVMTIGYHSTTNVWKFWASVSAIAFSLMISLMMFTIMLQKEAYHRIKKMYREYVGQPQKNRLRLHLEDTQSDELSDEEQSRRLNAKPIADFFSSATILFADIHGFAAWSSEREPAQVFALLQRLFYTFDKIAIEWDVLNVETIGDCYVACCGIPEFCEDHAVRMTRFAMECMVKFHELTHTMEKDLGPETCELMMRIGIASGPITAGVLQQNSTSKFHLYGWTADCAAAMLETSECGRVHVSQNTMELLIAAGKQHWVQNRKEPSFLAGLGELRTGFLVIDSDGRAGGATTAIPKADGGVGHSHTDNKDSAGSNSGKMMSIPSFYEGKGKEQRLVDWQVESMLKLLKKIKGYHSGLPRASSIIRNAEFTTEIEREETVLDEVKEVIRLPEFDAIKTRNSNNVDSITISPAAVEQLRDFVHRVANSYHDNPFHNFEHANHVVMAVHKFLNRITTPEDVDYERVNTKKIEADKHNYTFGITSDPLTHFAIVFSALVHDIDHRGVSNAQLAKEAPGLGSKYRNQSVAEQNSVDLAWDMLMEPQYKDLQQCIFHDRAEFIRFRQLVVNVVLATDIFDKELKALRNLRWDKAFHPRDEVGFTSEESFSASSSTSFSGNNYAVGVDENKRGLARAKSSKREMKSTSTNRKATIVIEHIIQASDVVHTMQHWNVYLKWNERLFQEMYMAFRNGQAPKDPSLGWYKGELWFYDFYVIPLAKKLSECGVFGVASDECLINAEENRRTWALSGEGIVENMLRRAKEKTRQSSLDNVSEGNSSDDYV